MNFVFDSFFLILGLIVGSFLNAALFRLHAGKSILGYSECTHCHHRLQALDLIPILSYVILGGKCRYCKSQISPQYPLVEAAAGIILLLLARKTFVFPISNTAGSDVLRLALEFAIACLLIGIFVFDLRHYLILDWFVFLGIFIAAIYRFAIPEVNLREGIWGALAVFGFFGLLYAVSQGRWIGLGDVKLGLFLGFYLGFNLSLLMLGLAYISGALVGAVLVFLQRRTIKGILPFGTFLSAATLVVMFWGDSILKWVSSFLYL